MSVLLPLHADRQPHILPDLLANPLSWTEPVKRSNLAPSSGLLEVIPGPPSPPSSPKKNGSRPLLNGVNGHKDTPEYNDEEEKGRSVAGPSTPPHLRGSSQGGHPPQSSSTLIENGSQSPSKAKGKGKAVENGDDTTSPARKSSTALKGLHPAITDTELTWPDEMIHYKKAGAGLNNPSMACYANATLQVMLHTPPLVREARNHDPRTCLLAKQNKLCLLDLLKEMLEHHWKAPRYTPPVHAKLGQIRKGFSRNRQEDSHEFFRFACDALQNLALAGLPKDLPEKIKHTTWVHRLWGGRVRSRVVCSKCSKPSDTFDHFLDLSLDCGKGKRDIEDMLQGFIKEDKLEGDNKYHCENCKSKANATKSFRIAEAPPILTLHLKRFAVNYNTWNGKARADKYNNHIGFEEYLDLAPYMVNTKNQNTKYRLFGVTCHRGVELRFGHYTAYIKSPSGKWFLADDEDMSPCSLDTILRDKTAYLLSYARIPEGETVPPLKPGNTQSAPTPKRDAYVNGTGNDQAANGASPMASANIPRSNGVGEKRKRDDQDELPTKMSIRLATPPPNRLQSSTHQQTPTIPPLFPSKLDPTSLLNNSPSSDNQSEENETKMRAFGANLSNVHNHKPPVISSNGFSPSSRFSPGKPGSPGFHRRHEKGKKHRRDRGRDSEGQGHHGRHSGGPPMPYRPGGLGFAGKKKGQLSRMKGR